MRHSSAAGIYRNFYLFMNLANINLVCWLTILEPSGNFILLMNIWTPSHLKTMLTIILISFRCGTSVCVKNFYLLDFIFLIWEMKLYHLFWIVLVCIQCLRNRKKYLCTTDPRKLLYVVHITVLCRCYISEKILQIWRVCFWSLCIS